MHSRSMISELKLHARQIRLDSLEMIHRRGTVLSSARVMLLPRSIRRSPIAESFLKRICSIGGLWIVISRGIPIA